MKNGAKSVEPFDKLRAIPSQARHNIVSGRCRDYLFTRVVLYSNKGRSTPHPQTEDDDIVHS